MGSQRKLPPHGGITREPERTEHPSGKCPNRSFVGWQSIMWQRRSPGLSLSLFSSFLLHWLRSTRDPRRRTRLGWSRTHTHTPERSHTAQERERDTHTRTWRASLHSHSSSSPLHGGKRWAGPYRPCLASTRQREIVAHDLVCSRLSVEIKHTDKFKDHKDVICTERSCIHRGIGQ